MDELRHTMTHTNEVRKMKESCKSEILRMEIQASSLLYKSREINSLINEDNVYKMDQVNHTDINNTNRIHQILKESPNIKLLTEYLDEIRRDLATINIELERKRSFYERINRVIYSNCDHLWISDHFENPALMSMVGCTYCNVCGMTRDDV
jgi:hypothetical protein